MNVRASLGMDGDDIGTCCGEGFEKAIDRGDHQVDVEGLGGVRAQRLHDSRADGEVRHEMPVHHVDVDPVRPGGIDSADFLAQPCEIGREDRRGDERECHG